jgi:hypothetical protein
MKTAEHWLDAAIKDCERLIAKYNAISKKRIPTYNGSTSYPLSKEDLKELDKVLKFDTRKHFRDINKAWQMESHYEKELHRLHQLRRYLELYT